jgi:K+-transporting ATPase ATPase B chain
VGLSRAIVSAAIRDSFAMLAPRVQFRNPVMFGVYVASIFATLIGFAAAFGAADGARRSFLRLRRGCG